MKKVIVLIICLTISLTVEAKNAAHNIYAHPDLPTLNDKYQTFTIDFKGTLTPEYTYWALCDWDMDTTELQKEFSEVNGFGAYAGLQTLENNKTYNGHVAIMSFWEGTYKDKNNNIKKINATRMYPEGEEKYFTGEGEGTKYITPYDWKQNNWYRMVIHTWNDNDTKTTFVGQWLYDIEKDEWTLISYFDTKLKNSYITGSLGQFQENFNSDNANEYRAFNIKNIYAKSNTTNDWISLNKARMSYDTGYENIGTHEFGVIDNTFFGKSGGIVENQEEYDANSENNIMYTINQNNIPETRVDKKVNLTLEQENKDIIIKWDYAGPQNSYSIKLINLDTKEIIATKEMTRPEKRIEKIENIKNKNIEVQIEIQDIYGNKENSSKTIELVDDKKDNVENTTVENPKTGKKNIKTIIMLTSAILLVLYVITKKTSYIKKI